MYKLFYPAFFLLFMLGAWAQYPGFDKEEDTNDKGALVSLDHTLAVDKTRSAPVITDNQIAAILVAINDGEIDAGRTAVRRSRNLEVKDFAQKMINIHRTNLTDTKRLMKNSNSSSGQSDLATSLKAETGDLNKELSHAGADNFDRIYMDQQVMMHEKVLAIIDDNLMPNVSDVMLRTHVVKTRTTFAEHLIEARNLQTNL